MGTPGEQQSSSGCVLTLMGCLLERGDPWKHVELESSTHLVHPEVLRVKTAEFRRGKIWTFGPDWHLHSWIGRYHDASNGPPGLP